MYDVRLPSVTTSCTKWHALHCARCAPISSARAPYPARCVLGPQGHGLQTTIQLRLYQQYFEEQLLPQRARVCCPNSGP